MANLKKAVHAPFTLHDELLRQISVQENLALKGKPAEIKARMNSLTESRLIDALYRASGNGVKSQLLVRGICSLRPGVSGLSENIRVVSVLGRFLEHSRIFAFGSGSEQIVYLSSADWMPRNMYHRVEVAVPVLDDQLRKRVVKESLDVYFRDDSYAWELQANGSYKRRKPRLGYSAQQDLLEKLNLRRIL